MVDFAWTLIGLFIIDFIIAWILRKTRLDHAFEAISTICVILPVMYSILDWNIGLQNGTYTQDDLADKITWLVLYGLGASFSGGIIGYFISGLGRNGSN